MKKVHVLIPRILLGFMFLLYGLDGFLHFMPPYPLSDKASTLIDAFINSGFLWPMMKAIQITAGILLLTDFYVPLALLLLAPLIVIIFCMHLFINPAGLPIGVTIVILELTLAWFYKDYFRSVLVRKAE